MEWIPVEKECTLCGGKFTAYNKLQHECNECLRDEVLNKFDLQH